MLKILLPVDGSGSSTRAAHYLAAIANTTPDLEIHLLNVQPPGDDWMVRRMLKAEELAALEQDWGNAALEPARDLLTNAGALVKTHVTQGDIAPSIIRLATELGCNQIVMGSHGRTGWTGLLMGSVASKVMHLSQMPITFIK
jgi:nucleotide-binding universal stress UspA family protein